MKGVVKLKDEHEFLRTIVGAFLKHNWSHILSSDIVFEKEFRSSKGYVFRIDVYAELKKGVPIIAEVKPFIVSPDECFRFVYLCNEVRPYIAFFVSHSLSEGARLVLEQELFISRSRDGKENRRQKVSLVDEGVLRGWFDEVKPFLRLEGMGYLSVEL